MVDIDSLLSFGIPGFLHEHGNHAVKTGLHFPEYNPESADIQEHVVRVAEHHIVCRRVVEAGVPGGADASVRLLEVLDFKGIRVQKVLFKKNIGAIIHDDDPDVFHFDGLLDCDGIKQRLDHLIRLVVLWYENLKFHWSGRLLSLVTYEIS